MKQQVLIELNGIDREGRLELPLAVTSISLRTLNALEEQGVRTVEQMLSKTRDWVLSVPNFGRGTLQEILDAMEELGFVAADKGGREQ